MSVIGLGKSFYTMLSLTAHYHVITLHTTHSLSLLPNQQIRCQPCRMAVSLSGIGECPATDYFTLIYLALNTLKRNLPKRTFNAALQ